MNADVHMARLLTRQFELAAPLKEVWARLAQVEEWPRWAAHIRRIDVTPPGPVGRDSAGVICLSNGIRSTFRMTEFNQGRNWKWVGPFLWLSVHYDHQFEEISPTRVRLTWIVDADGRGAWFFGPLFSMIYARNLDKAIPRFVSLVEEGRK